MKIGTFLLQVVKLQEICALPSLSEALMHPAIAGICCVDGDTKVYDRLDLAETKRILDFHGLYTSSVYHVAHCDEMTGAGKVRLTDDLHVQLERCALMETGMLMPVPTCSPDVPFHDCRQRMAEYFAMAAELAAPYGIKAVLENYSRAGSTCASVADVGWYLSQIPQLDYVLDTGNFWFTGSDVLEACRRYFSRIRHVHIKDVKGMTDNPPKMIEGRGYDCVTLGAGETPLADILQILEQGGYNDVLSVEVLSPVGLVEKLDGSVRYLKERLG